MSKDTKDLSVVNGGFQPPALNSDMGQAMAEEMDGLTITFDRVKIPTGGGLAFEVPGDDPDSPDMVKELCGVIVDHHPVNAYWAVKFEGQNNPPDCSSMDGKCGVGEPGGNCKNCPFNQFGSADDGKGKKCKNMHRVYLLRSGEAFPLLLTLPPTSIKAFSDYMAKRIITKGLRSYGVVTRVTLKKAQNGAGITYSQAQFEIEERLEPDAVKVMQDYAANIRTMTRNVAITENTDIDMPGADNEIPF